jgi:hypothetical protein
LLGVSVECRPVASQDLKLHSLQKQLLPNREAFAADPFGYSSMAWMKWALAQEIAGIAADPSVPPTSRELKNPVLWLTQAHALSEAAAVVLRGSPQLDHLPIFVRGVCDSQYCAVGLMLVGYSLEICLKAMIILQKGVDEYESEERSHRHHKLVKLSEFIPELSEKEKAILILLTHFLEWAGRYPDPGSGRETNAKSLFDLSEMHQVSARDLFSLAARVMGYVKVLTP